MSSCSFLGSLETLEPALRIVLVYPYSVVWQGNVFYHVDRSDPLGKKKKPKRNPYFVAVSY